MSEILYRSYGLVQARAAEGDGRTLDIRAVPWDTEIQVGPAEWESFDRGAFDAQLRAADRIKLTLGHPRPGDRLTDSIVGRVTGMRVEDDGLHLETRMASTPTASDALALVNDEALDEVSIGFLDIFTDRSDRPGGGRLLRRTAARLHHIALVADGAYGQGARVLAVREHADPEPAPVADQELVEARSGLTLADLRLVARGITG